MKVDNNVYKKVLDNINDGVFFVDMDRKITYWNDVSEKITGYSSSEVIGKRCSDNVLIHIDDKGENVCKKHCPLDEAVVSGTMQKAELYLLHKKGYRLPVLVRTAPIRNSNNKIIGVVEIFTDNSSKIASLERIRELQKEALLDHLTGLGNRHYTEMNLQGKINELQRYKLSFGVLFIDIDQFKKVNDIYGHDIGDEVLKMVAMTLSGNLRRFDSIGRWGGEEFVVIVVNVDRKRLYRIAKKLCLLVAKSGLTVGSETVRVTVSVGAALAKPVDSVFSLIKRADELMYQSKASGKNRVSMELLEK